MDIKIRTSISVPGLCLLILSVILAVAGDFSSSLEGQALEYYYSMEMNYYNTSQKFCFDRVGKPVITSVSQPGRCIRLPGDFQISGKNYVKPICETIRSNVHLKIYPCTDSQCNNCAIPVISSWQSGENFCSFNNISNRKYLLNYRCNQCYCEDCDTPITFSRNNSIFMSCPPGEFLIVDRIAALVKNGGSFDVITIRASQYHLFESGSRYEPESRLSMPRIYTNDYANCFRTPEGSIKLNENGAVLIFFL